jgi:hypothetical protein
MGKGHMMFFYDKALYLKKRTDQLYRALRKRGYKVEYWPYPVEKHPIGYRNDWTPSSDDQVICRSRITERIAANPSKHSWEVLKG